MRKSLTEHLCLLNCPVPEPGLDPQFFSPTPRLGSEVAAVIEAHPSFRFLVSVRGLPRWTPFLLVALLAGRGQPATESSTVQTPANRQDNEVTAEKQKPSGTEAGGSQLTRAAVKEDEEKKAAADKAEPVGSVAEKDLLNAA